MPLSDAFTPFQSLRNPVFARLYAAQTASLLGDALTWVGLALLAFELGGSHSAGIPDFGGADFYSARPLAQRRPGGGR